MKKNNNAVMVTV